VTVKNWDGGTGASAAAAGGHSVIAAALPDKGADINVSQDGETAFTLAAVEGHVGWWSHHRGDKFSEKPTGDTPSCRQLAGIAKL